MDAFLIFKLLTLVLDILSLPLLVFIWFKFREANRLEMEHLNHLSRRIDRLESTNLNGKFKD